MRPPYKRRDIFFNQFNVFYLVKNLEIEIYLFSCNFSRIFKTHSARTKHSIRGGWKFAFKYVFVIWFECEKTSYARSIDDFVIAFWSFINFIIFDQSQREQTLILHSPEKNNNDLRPFEKPQLFIHNLWAENDPQKIIKRKYVKCKRTYLLPFVSKLIKTYSHWKLHIILHCIHFNVIYLVFSRETIFALFENISQAPPISVI